jgi:hypothetical protein
MIKSLISKSLPLVMAVMLCTILCQAQKTEYNYSTGNVEGRNHVGGLIGGCMQGEGTISNSYARGNVIGSEYAGGLIGSSSVTISHTYSTGSVSGSDQAGGLAGSNTGTITGSYWNTQTSGQATSAGGIGQNTAAMTHPYGTSAFVGWDFTSIWAADISPPKNNGYPYLRHSPVYELALRVYPQGAGTVNGAGVYRSTEQVIISATAQNDYAFTGWSQDGNIIHTAPSQTISLSSNTTMTAVFSKQTTSIPSSPDPLSQIMIYPNPAKDNLVVETSGSADILLSVAIINLLGQTLLFQPANDPDRIRVYMNISGLAPGTYLVMARFQNSFGVEKLIVR